MIRSVVFRVRALWERLRGHILFVPGVIVFVMVVLAVAAVETDRRIDEETVRGIPWIFRAGASGAREVLSTIATAMIQLAAITFSVTIVALALRSQQFGPRLLRNFTGDPMNQAVLGAFIGTFLFALLVLRAVRDLDEVEGLESETFVPLISVTVGIGLATISLALFVVFIDRIVTAIQANSIIAQVANETNQAIDRLFPEPLGSGPAAEVEPEDEEMDMEGAVGIPAEKTGYVQTLDADSLMRIAREADLVLRMEAPVGGFVVKGTPLVVAAPRQRVDDRVRRKVQRLYTIGRNRSVKNDPEFGVRQIVDIAVKALSPSDNDPTTAATATEYLGALLIDFATRDIPSRRRRDDRGEVRVIATGPTFRSMTDLALDQIREHGTGDLAATRQLLITAARVGVAVRAGPRRRVLAEHVCKIARAADRGIEDPADRRSINRLLEDAVRALAADGPMLDQVLLSTDEPTK
jgi:uncharacterized membrane protein